MRRKVRRAQVASVVVKVIAVMILIVAGIFFATNVASKQETKECLQWQKQASETPGFYLNQWQADQCEARKILIKGVEKIK